MTEHVGCMLAIVGSRDVVKAPALELIGKVLDEHRPIIVISGGAKCSTVNRIRGLASIDEEAAIVARERGLTVLEFRPTNFHWNGPGGFMERNIQIAESCVCLVRIASSTTATYGSGWTANKATSLGKDVTRYTVMADGSIVEGEIEHEQG